MLLLSSCNMGTKTNAEKTLNEIQVNSILEISGIEKIELPDSIPNPDSIHNLYWNSDKNYLGFIEDIPIENKIYIYLYEFDKKKWKIIPLSKEGPNQVYSLGSFAFENYDTIIYFPSSVPRVIRVDLNGNVISNNEFSKKYSHGINVSVFNPRPIKIDSSLGFLTTEYLHMDRVESYKQASLFTVYDFDTNVSNHLIKYPDEFIGNIWSSNDLFVNSIYNNNGDIILNFSKSHYLYIYDKMGKLKEKVNARIKQIRDAKPDTNNSDALQDMLRAESNGRYKLLIYDEWRNVYYRIASFYDTNTKPNPKNFQELQNLKPYLTHAIITLDENFKVIGQDFFKVEESEIGAQSYFVNENGLYLHSTKTDSNHNLYFVKLILK